MSLQDDISYYMTKISSFSPNLFECTDISNYYGGGHLPIVDMKYFASSLSIPGYSMDAERDQGSKKFLPKKVNRTDEITIKWFDSELMHVRQYHKAWMDEFYDFTGDFWKVGPGSKKRNIQFKVYGLGTQDFGTRNSSEVINGIGNTIGYDSNYFKDKKNPKTFDLTRVIMTVNLIGLIPSKFFDFDLDWDSTSDQSWDMSYFCEDYYIEYGGAK